MKAARFFVFTTVILLIFFACKKEYSYERGPADLQAKGSLQKKSGSCAPVTVHGEYKAGTVLENNNYVTVQVHFTSPGRYRIFTDHQNGFSFQDSAIVTDTGYHYIKLKATGTPIREETTNFLVAFDTSICSFSIPFVSNSTVQNPPGINLSDSAWQFSVDSQKYSGFLDGALTQVLNGSTIITLVGLTATKDTAIALIINMAGLPILTGSYKTPIASTFIFFASNGKDIYMANKAMAGVELIVVITKYEATTRIIEGNFSGTVLNADNTPVPLKEGKFRAQLSN